MTAFGVDFEVVESMIEQMAAFERHVESVRGEVDARMRRVHSVWRGVAASESADAHARWTAGAQEMHEALAALQAIASTAQQNYAAAVRANTTMWSL